MIFFFPIRVAVLYPMWPIANLVCMGLIVLVFILQLTSGTSDHFVLSSFIRYSWCPLPFCTWGSCTLSET